MNKIKQWLDAVMTGNANVGKPMQDTDVVLSYGGAQVTVADILALCTTPQQSLIVPPKPNTWWTHYNGQRYNVLMILNEYSTKEEYPPIVAYQGVNGKVWGRPVADWHRSMTPEGK
jgi:hypothetical protein